MGALKDVGCPSIDIIRVYFDNDAWVEGSIWIVDDNTYCPEGRLVFKITDRAQEVEDDGRSSRTYRS